jgi:DNA gyrase subunit A
VNLLQLSGEEKATSAIAIRSFDEKKGKESFLFLCTRNGTVKRTALADFANIRRTGIAAITLEEGDVLVDVQHTSGKDEIIIGTQHGRAIRFAEKDVREMGRAAKGVRGILLTVCEHGYGKRTELSEYRDQHRGGGGIITIKATERNGAVVGVKLVRDEDDLMIMTASGMAIRLHCKDIKTISRNTQGVRLVRLNDGDKVARVAPVVGEEGGGEPAQDAAAPQPAPKAGPETPGQN